MAAVEQHKYQNQWQAYRKHQTLLGVLLIAEFLAFVPFVVLVVTLEKSLFQTNKMFLPAAIFWGAIYMFTGAQLRRFSCPRCKENFFGGFFATPTTVMGRSCANCGLRKYEGE
jgi:hypothetical protein